MDIPAVRTQLITHTPSALVFLHLTTAMKRLDQALLKGRFGSAPSLGTLAPEGLPKATLHDREIGKHAPPSHRYARRFRLRMLP